MTTPHPVLYSFRRCPYAMRARLALREAGIRCELREVVLRDKPSHLIALSPKATVPVLWLQDGTVLEESLDIMEWAMGVRDPSGWLEADRDEMNGLISDNDGPFKHHLDRYKYANRYEGADAASHRAGAEEVLKGWESRLAQTAFLQGPKCTLSDVAIAPFVRQFANADRVWFDGAPYPNLQRWLTAFLKSERFQAIMLKYEQWVSDAEPVWFGADS